MATHNDFQMISGLTVNTEKTKVVEIGGWKDSEVSL